VNLDVLESMGQTIEQMTLTDDNIAERVETLTAGADMIVDSLFGTGLSGQLGDEYNQLIKSLNSLNCPVLAVDIPSGLDCDTSQPLRTAIQADYTVTFVALKRGFTTKKAAQYTGEIFIASIGIVR